MDERKFRAGIFFPYQKKAFKLALDKPTEMLFTEPGLGMTVEMLAIQSQDRSHRRKNAMISFQITGVEEQIIRGVIRALIGAGYAVSVDDGAEVTVERSRDADAIFEAMRTTDQDFLLAFEHAGRAGWVRFIYGNADWEVINDYTTNLESVMKPINDAIDKYQERR